MTRHSGRAYRRARQSGHPAPRFAAAAYRLTDALTRFGATADGVWRTIAQVSTAPPPRGRPLIHNGRKYHR